MQKRVKYRLTPNTPTVFGLVGASWLLTSWEASFLRDTLGVNWLSVLLLLAGYFATPWLLFLVLEKVVFLLFIKRRLK